MKTHNKKLNTFGVDSEKETPDPIPNSAVKLLSGDDTVPARVWESSTMPFYARQCESNDGLFFMECFLLLKYSRLDVEGGSWGNHLILKNLDYSFYHLSF